jgi:hypothetical protein
MIGLLVISCGRPQYLAATLASAKAMLQGIDGPRVIVDDSADPAFHEVLRKTDFDLVLHDHKRGLSGAVQSGWDAMDCDYVFHLEEDFTFPKAVNLTEIVGWLEAVPNLAQMALLRQPWSPVEHAAGGIIQTDPDVYVPRGGYEEHAKLFTLNPCVYPRWVTEVGWPEGGGEREFTDRLLGKYPESTFGFLGSRNDSPRCIHIGYESALFSPSGAL